MPVSIMCLESTLRGIASHKKYKDTRIKPIIKFLVNGQVVIGRLHEHT